VTDDDEASRQQPNVLFLVGNPSTDRPTKEAHHDDTNPFIIPRIHPADKSEKKNS
jgi:hypothetical protein